MHVGRTANERAFSLFELMATMAVMGIAAGTVISNYRELNDPLQNSANQIVTQMKHARIKAIATTSAYLVQPTSANTIEFRYGATCANTPTTDTALALELDPGVSLADTNWSLCFSSRGLSDTSLDLDVLEGTRLRIVEILIGGSIRVKKEI
jgi:prepilin-type N-terminal cleavage/methylation domain-containing protein